MKNSPLQTFGFANLFNEKELAIDMLAHTKKEAIERVSAMSKVEFVGELKENASVNQMTMAPSDSGSRRSYGCDDSQQNSSRPSVRTQVTIQARPSTPG